MNDKETGDAMNDFNQRYIAARRRVIAGDLRRLNPAQRQAAMTTEGPVSYTHLTLPTILLV